MFFFPETFRQNPATGARFQKSSNQAAAGWDHERFLGEG